MESVRVGNTRGLSIRNPVSVESSDDKYTMKVLTFHSRSRRRITVHD